MLGNKAKHCNAAVAGAVDKKSRLCRPALTLLLALAGVSLPFFTVPAGAIVIRHDRADAGYIVDASLYPQIFFLHTRQEHKVCIATMISTRWAITAGHCIDDTPIGSAMTQHTGYALQVNGQSYSITHLVMHPDYQNGKLLQGVDLALIQLDREVEGINPVSLNQNSDEAYKVATLLGWGYTGTGTTGRNSNDGKFRRAENMVEVANLWLQFSFDDPRAPASTALGLEGIPGLGDSGGPALLETEQGLSLLGVAIGELDRNDAALQQGEYGATEVYERISRHLDWISHTIGLHDTIGTGFHTLQDCCVTALQFSQTDP